MTSCASSSRSTEASSRIATGSACANLGGWHYATAQPLPVARTLRQGEQVSRPSRLGLRVAADGAIYVTGAVIELGRGSIDL